MEDKTGLYYKLPVSGFTVGSNFKNTVGGKSFHFL